MRDVLEITKALADGSRLRMLMALTEGELCVCQIVELLQRAPSTVSKHMQILHHARLVEGRKQGRWMFYRLAAPTASSPVQDAIDWARRHLNSSPQIREDRRRLKAILKIDPETLCRTQSAN
jgi:DNA-binding transcriptional ArsR family regulator